MSYSHLVCSAYLTKGFCKIQDDKNVAHLTHVSEMEKKIETLARITTILKDVIQNKVIFFFCLRIYYHCLLDM